MISFSHTSLRVCVHHQMEAQTEEQAADAQKEKKLRERNEQYSRQLEEELEGLKVSLHRHVLLTCTDKSSYSCIFLTPS